VEVRLFHQFILWWSIDEIFVSLDCSPPDNEESKLQTLGKLMNDSHESCNKQFDCSHSKVNDLVQVARSFSEMETGRGKGKVYGSRVTGEFFNPLLPFCFS
jgi:galactokinase